MYLIQYLKLLLEKFPDSSKSLSCLLQNLNGNTLSNKKVKKIDTSCATIIKTTKKRLKLNFYK